MVHFEFDLSWVTIILLVIGWGLDLSVNLIWLYKVKKLHNYNKQ